MSDGYTKLFGSIVRSSVWSEPAHVRLVWITMLALVNQDGVVVASVPGLAAAARVSLEECEQALTVFTSPDKYSSSKAHEGRRVAEVDGGWLLLNHGAYRDRMSAEDRKVKTADRTRKWRERHSVETVRSEASLSVTERHEASLSVTVTECDARDDMQIQIQKQIQIQDPPKPPRGRPRREPRKMVSIPRPFPLTEKHKGHAVEKGWPVAWLASVRDSFEEKALAKAWTYADWDMALYNYARNEIGYGRGPQVSGRLQGQRLPAPRQPDSGYDPFAAAEMTEGT